MSARSDAGANVFGRLAAWCARRWKLVVGIWVAAFLLLAPAAASLQDRLTPGGFEITGSTSDDARKTLQRALPGRSPSSLVVVLESEDPGALTGSLGWIKAAVAPPAANGIVGAVVTSDEQPILSRPDLGLELIGLELTKGIDDALKDMDALSRVLEEAVPASVTVRTTGGTASFRDFNEVNERDLRQAEIVQIPVLVLILLLVLGTAVAAAMPLVTTLIALVCTLGGLAFVARGVDLSIYVANVVPLVGIGVAVDYALFIVNRFREEIAAGKEPPTAVAATGASAGRAIFFSGVTVIVALAGMLAVGVPIFTAFAIGTVAVVAMAILIALTLLPAVLGGLGHRVNRFPVGIRLRRLIGVGRAPASGGRESRWARWAELVMRRPWPFLLGAIAVMLALAVPALDMRLSSSGVTALPEDVPSRQAAARVAQALGEGYATPHTIVIEGRAAPPTASALTAFQNAILDESEVAAILPAPPGALASDPPGVIRSADGRVAVFALAGRHNDDDPRAQALAGRMLEIAAAQDGLRDTRVHIGGAASQNRDFTATVSDNLPLVIGLVMLLTFCVLVVLFRSLLLPLKAVVMTLVSSLAAYGVLVMVFQYGWGAGLLGVEPLGHVTSWVPPFLFSILFGLSMDYEVFLLSRVREHRDRHGDDRAALAWGLSRTGGTITAAAAIMLVVFVSFMSNRLIPIKEASLGLAVAIFLDATLVRIVLVPAFMRLAGRWNWWLPGWLDRLLPDAHVEGEAAAGSVRLVEADPDPGPRSAAARAVPASSTASRKPDPPSYLSIVVATAMVWGAVRTLGRLLTRRSRKRRRALTPRGG